MKEVKAQTNSNCSAVTSWEKRLMKQRKKEHNLLTQVIGKWRLSEQDWK